MKKQLLTLLMTLCCSLAAAQGLYNVRDYGAKGDGKTLDHGAVVSRAPIIQSPVGQARRQPMAYMLAMWMD